MKRRIEASRARAWAAALCLGAVGAYAGPAPAADPAVDPAAIGTTPQTSVRSRVAWALLADRREDQAARHFSRLTQQFPEHGEPRIGYSLSIALLGDLPCGARAMHRAMLDDPEALGGLAVDSRLEERLEGLAARYLRALAGCGGRDDSAYVMLAALHYLLRDEPEVRRTLRLAEETRHYGAALVYLDRLAGGADPRPVLAVAVVEETPAQTEVAEAVPAEPEPEPAPVEPAAPAADEVAATEAPEPEPFVGPPEPPVDYGKLRDDLSEVAGALERFSRKLMGKVLRQQ